METKEKPLKQGIASYIMLCLFTAWNVCFFMPMDIYIPNADDIEIPIKPLAACLGIVTLAVFAVTLAVCLLTKGKANRIFRAALFGVSIAFYIQGNFLAVNMGEFNGEKYALSFWKTALSIIVWLVVLTAAFVLLWKLPEEFDGLVGRIAAALIVVQFAALGISAYNNIPKYSADKLVSIMNGESISYCSAKDLNLYSKNKNVIIILADEYESYLFDSALKEAPETVSEFDGFTYYTNTVGKYALTDQSMAYITSGSTIGKGYTDLTFFKASAENFKANFYSAFYAPPVAVLDDFYDNAGFVRLSFGESMLYSKNIFRLALFRCMPEPLKPLFWFDAQNMGGDIAESLERKLQNATGAGSYDPDILAFYNTLPRELDETDEDVFKFIYILGVHAPRNVTKDLTRSVGDMVSPEDSAIAVNKIINEYLKILKENGVYDNSEIIFMADHGLSGHYNKRYPLLMYKPANQTETGIKISKAPISYDEMFPTFKMLAGAEPGGRTIFDIAEDEQRVRFFGVDNLEITETEKPKE
ncbi:MAG: LTA synthase family protein [Oscillospiraceae bacterium]|nr:LTA synthase family protein [Oscillospiraceae bacterium]